MTTPSGSERLGGGTSSGTGGPGANLSARLFGAWLFVGIPLAYGIVQTVRRAAALFTG